MSCALTLAFLQPVLCPQVSVMAQTEDIDYGDTAVTDGKVKEGKGPMPKSNDRKVDADEVPDKIHGIELNHHSSKLGDVKPKMRGDKPFVFSNQKVGQGLDEIIAFIEKQGMLSAA